MIERVAYLIVGSSIHVLDNLVESGNPLLIEGLVPIVQNIQINILVGHLPVLLDVHFAVKNYILFNMIVNTG